MTVQATSLYPFVPSGRDFRKAIEFFEAIGFRMEWEEEGFAGLRFGSAFFVLQQIDVPEWQTNQMITFEVDDLEGYWRELENKNLPAAFDGVRLREPTAFPWGREVHIIDPGGVCWHVRQTRAAR